MRHTVNHYLVWLAFTASLSFGGAAFGQEFYGTFESEATITTQYIKTSGLLGRMFGHISKSDVEGLLKATQESIVRDLVTSGVDVENVRFLPIEISGYRERVLGSVETERQGFFGQAKINEYQQFEAKVVVQAGFMLPKSDALKMGRRITTFAYKISEPTEVALKVIAKNRLGEFQAVFEVKDIPPGALKLSAYSAQSAGDEVGKVNLRDAGIPSAMRYDLGRKVREFAATEGLKYEDVRIGLVADIKDNQGGDRTHVLATETGEFDVSVQKFLQIRGIGRFFSPSYYFNMLSDASFKRQLTGRPGCADLAARFVSFGFYR